MNAKTLAVHCEHVADARAERLVAARRVVREARARFDAAKLADDIECTRESLDGFERAEFELHRAEKALKSITPRAERSARD